MSLRITIATLLLSVSASASAAELLNYSYGNQIFGSELQIFDDGRVLHKERNCCPPKTEEVTASPLTAAQTYDVVSLISAAAKGPFRRGKCPGNLGEKYGNFLARLRDGTIVTLRSTEMHANGKCIQTVNLSKAARELEQVVYSFVEVKPE
jgi:hypothetical protein